MGSISLQDGEKARLTITKEQENEISKLYHQVYLKYKKQMNALPLQGEGTVSQSLKKTYLNKLTKQLKESKDYDVKIAHLALSRINIDLDDGVKANYEKVQTGQDGKKIEILAPIK